MATEKVEFSAQSLQSLMEKICKEPRLLDTDWREIVRSHFKLLPDQEKSLVNLSPEKVRHIQDHLKKAALHIRQGGKVTGELVKRGEHERADGMMYDVVVELVGKK